MLRLLGLLFLLFIGFVIFGDHSPDTRGGASPSPAQPDKPRLSETECRHDKQCWYDKNNAAAKVACETAVARKAKYDIKWTDAWYEPKFDRGSVNLDNGEVNVAGDKVQFQNGFGAWQRMSYLCTYKPDTRDVSVFIQEGMWPPE